MVAAIVPLVAIIKLSIAIIEPSVGHRWGGYARRRWMPQNKAYGGHRSPYSDHYSTRFVHCYKNVNLKILTNKVYSGHHRTYDGHNRVVGGDQRAIGGPHSTVSGPTLGWSCLLMVGATE
ncbi:hypothetical protein FNV43_RR04298 [Rhamnella rubrinervis]|uniref:Secreted protein n=1 Tax=Rhamnella rubrinervis TaxID=2594499 RepID=A0A8K0HJB2_9ROSA|nr:hypothetical protein FNV43_RR04298 [Rhamnella rubrinervis]